MKKIVLFAVLACATQAFGQGIPGYPIPQQVVENQTVVQPPMPMPAQTGPIPTMPPRESFEKGWTETWQHDFSPHTYQQQATQVVYPQQPQQQYYYPQQQYYCPQRCYYPQYYYRPQSCWSSFIGSW